MSIDNPAQLPAILSELRSLGTVTVETDMTIISVVGDLRPSNESFESVVVAALKEIPIRVISYGGSEHNISLLIRSDDKTKALQALSKNLF